MRSSVAFSILACAVGTATADSVSPTNSATSVSSTSASGSSCAAQAVLDDCLGLEQPQLAACETNNWDCMCNQANNVLTCYNNCPNDPNAFSAQQVKVSYCNAASVYGTSASAVPTSTGTPSQPSNVSPSGAQSSDASETSSSSTPLESSDSSSASAATPSSSSVKSEKGVATGLVINVGSLLVAVILGMGAAI